MRLTKKSGGVVAAVVMAGGLTAASAASAFADAPAHGSKTASAAKGSEHAKKDAKKGTAKTHKGHHHRLGMHGERTVKGKDGKTVVHEWQSGTVTAVSGNTVTVKSADGFTLTWTVDSATKVHAGPAGAKAKVGDKVLVEGVKSGAVNQAHIVLDRTARHAGKNAEKPGDKDKNTPPAGKHRKPGTPQDHDGTAAAHTA
ncbi:MAG: hypothetical protein HOV66_21895 [Streptomycetaceae bacterium]|nr:hypothetical protein [Streptomycetaceae bacterium]